MLQTHVENKANTRFKDEECNLG